MKKTVSIILSMLAVFLFGSTSANAQEKTYWEEYFEENYSNGLSQYGGFVSLWEDINMSFSLVNVDGMGDMSDPLLFYPEYYTNNIIFNDVENVTIKSSDETIMTGEVKSYDFSKEKESFNNYVKWYNELTLDEFKQYLIDYGYEDWAESFKEKPIWWMYNGWESEPTWWAMYGFESEPTNAVEVITHAKDLGNATLTVSAKDKEDIKINSAMEIVDGIEPEGVVQILNNLDRYKDIMPGTKADNWIWVFAGKAQEYDFSVPSSSEDLSNLINTLKGKDITVLFYNYSGIGDTSYVLNGKDITNTVSEGFTYDSNISMETSINKDKIDSLVELKDAIYIDFTYHGILPAPYKLNVNVENYIVDSFFEQLGCEQYDWASESYNTCWNNAWDKSYEYFDNTTFDLLYYNPETEKMEVVKQDLKAKNGVITLEFDHFSSYVLVASSNYTITNKASNNAQTSSMNIALYGGIALISLVGIAYLLIKKNKKKIA